MQNPIHLLAGQAPPPVLLPLFLSRVSAGFPSPAEDYLEGRLDLQKLLVRRPASTFLVRVTGDSMLGDGIHEGDLLVVDRSLKASPGRVVIAVVDGELLVKRLGRKDGRPVLLASNPKYSPVAIGDESQFEVWGTVTFVIHDL